MSPAFLNPNKKWTLNGSILAPQVGLEPTTLRLTAGCSAIELLRLLFIKESQHLPIFPGRLQPSIFGTTQLNFRVRDGNGWGLSVIGTGFLYVIAKFPLLQQLFQFGDR